MAPPSGEIEHRYIGTAQGDHNTINVTYNNGKTKLIDTSLLLNPIDESRLQAANWKKLHKVLYEISEEAIDVRRLIARKKEPGEFMRPWQSCSDNIEEFIKLKCLPETPTRSCFDTEMKEKKWLEQLGKCRWELDDIIGSQKIEEDAFLELERLSRRILKLLDNRLQTAIEAIDAKINDARKHLTEPPILPEATS